MRTFAFYTAEDAEIPHVGVYTNGHVENIVATFLIGPLELTTAEALAKRTIAFLESDGGAV